jgi:sulfate permease, SulP family
MRRRDFFKDAERSRKGGWLMLFQGIRPFDRVGAIRDALAGVELAAMNIPQALGYTKIAGTPVVTGFYTLLLPLVAFATFGSSRYLVVAADSATAAIFAGGVSGMAPINSARYVVLAGLVALLTAGFLLLARAFRLGFLADFLSQTVLLGFLTGVGFQVGIAVLGEMLGLQLHSHRSIGYGQCGRARWRRTGHRPGDSALAAPHRAAQLSSSHRGIG